MENERGRENRSDKKKEDVNGITIKSTIGIEAPPFSPNFFSLRSPSAMDCPFEITKNYMLIIASTRNCNFFLERKKRVFISKRPKVNLQRATFNVTSWIPRRLHMDKKIKFRKKFFLKSNPISLSITLRALKKNFSFLLE